MLIAGCSHTAGSEIDGSADSEYNRNLSYGNTLAMLMGYRPINIAVCGYTNGAIARSVLEWFNKNYDPSIEVFVLVGWTESARIEAPFPFPTWHQEVNGKYCDWFSNSSTDFLQINAHHKAYSEREKEIQTDYQKFVVRYPEYLEIVSANLLLQLQYFFKYKKVQYLMCNTTYMFSPENEKYLKCYIENIDATSYYQEEFYKKYKNLGYINTQALYGHHGEEPHKLYAQELLNFINKV